MGRSKEHFAGSYPRSGGRAWLDANSRHRCPVCGSDSWCQLARDGQTVLCKRTPSGITRTNADGAEYHVHHLGDRAPHLAAPPPMPSSDRASRSRCDEVYRALLAMLSLSDGHRRALGERGLHAEHISAGGYRSLGLEGRARIARELAARVGEPVGVPGFFVQNEGGRSWWSLAGSPGLLVPVRDLEGRIVALKIRRDGAGEGPRYLYLTSASKGGASADCALHVPLFAKPGAVLRVTEGELKADVATALSGLLTVSVPGVGGWRRVLEALPALRPQRVLVAFDRDALTNPIVARAQLACVRALRDRGASVSLERWPGEHKGIDDFLAARSRAEVNIHA